MRVAILGPRGQLGTDLLRTVGDARLGQHSIELLPLGREVLDVEHVERVADVLSTLEFDVLVNCTGYHKTDEVEGNATRAFAVNAHAVAQMATACASSGRRFVHVSTDYVFDGAVRSPYDESDAPRPLNVYGASKHMGETLVLSSGRDALVLRVASLFGIAGASGKGGNFVETMIRMGREKGQLRVVDDITMSPTGTEDVAITLFKLLLQNAPPGLYHVVNSGEATWCQFARRIVERAAVQATVEPVGSDEYPTAARRPPYSVLSNAKVQSIAGPLPSWEEALDRYLMAKGYR